MERGLVLAKQVLSQLSYTPTYNSLILIDFLDADHLLFWQEPSLQIVSPVLVAVVILFFRRRSASFNAVGPCECLITLTGQIVTTARRSCRLVLWF